LADDRAFQKRYMDLPLEVKDARGKKVVGTVESDEGVFRTSSDGLAKLRPVLPEGTVTFGSQTHPADGNCGMVVASRERARAMSKDAGLEVQVLSYGQGRVKKGFMAMATVPAAKALQPVRVVAHLRSSAGTDRHPPDHRTDRGTGARGRRLRPVRRLRGRGHRGGGGSQGRELTGWERTETRIRCPVTGHVRARPRPEAEGAGSRRCSPSPRWRCRCWWSCWRSRTGR
jgi:hypothetical protein